MGEAPKKRRLKIVILERAVIVFSGLVLVYVLSMGPSYLALREGVMGQNMFSSIYSPIFHIAGRGQSMGRFFDWYLEFWYSDVKEMKKSLRNAGANSPTNVTATPVVANPTNGIRN
jgi:hypothetical protein